MFVIILEQVFLKECRYGCDLATNNYGIVAYN